MTASGPLSQEPLIGYLASCGGCDRFDFHDDHGEPDPIAARAFAESLRATYGTSLGVSLTVAQVANRVTVCVITETASV